MGIIVATFGSIIIMFDVFNNKKEISLKNVLIGDTLALISTFSMGFYFYYISRSIRKVPPMIALTTGVIVSTIFIILNFI